MSMGSLQTVLTNRQLALEQTCDKALKEGIAPCLGEEHLVDWGPAVNTPQ